MLRQTPWRYWLYSAVACAMLVFGCSSLARKIPEPTATGPGAARQLYQSPTNGGMRSLAWLGVVGIGAGVALAVFLPGNDKIPHAIIPGAGSILGVSLFVQHAAPILPWAAGAALVMGLGWLGWRLWSEKRDGDGS